MMQLISCDFWKRISVEQGSSDENRRLVLGIEGNAMWKDGENWQKYMRNWKSLAEPETRLKESGADGKMFVFDMQRFAKGKPRIGTAERLHIESELNTWLRKEDFDGEVRHKAIGDYIYVFRAFETSDYEFIEKKRIRGQIRRWKKK